MLFTVRFAGASSRPENGTSKLISSPCPLPLKKADVLSEYAPLWARNSTRVVGAMTFITEAKVCVQFPVALRYLTSFLFTLPKNSHETWTHSHSRNSLGKFPQRLPVRSFTPLLHDFNLIKPPQLASIPLAVKREVSTLIRQHIEKQFEWTKLVLVGPPPYKRLRVTRKTLTLAYPPHMRNPLHNISPHGFSCCAYGVEVER